MDIEEYAKYQQFYIDSIPELLLKYLKNTRRSTYLDLGCGDGSLLYALNKEGYFKDRIIYCVDLSANRINLVKKINKDFLCYVDDACDIKSIKNDSINFLVSEQLIEHVENDEKMAKEICRVVKKDATVYLSTVSKKWYGWYFYRCNGKWTLDPTHLREYTNDRQLLDLFTKNGLEVVENKKTLIRRSVIEFVLKRLKVDSQIFIRHPFFKKLRIFKIPIPGYYYWEIVCKKI